ncbi:MAG: uracil-DNA glycosylase [Candidatus Methanofastidiosia archaeon]
MERLQKLEEKCTGCTACDLSKERTNVVYGEGPLNADIVLVGEAPGKKEDETGRPFVGRAGTLLDKTLEKTGITRDSVYITNIVKCRPPANRTPRKKEVDTCILLYLYNQIEIIDPFVVVMLGNTPLKTFIGETGITDVHGSVYEKDRLYLATFHPAGILYRRSLLDSFEKDVKKALEIVQKSDKKS